MISLPQQRVLCRNPHHPAWCMRSEPCLFSNPPELWKRSRHLPDAGDACDGPVLFRRSPRRSRRDDSVLNADFPRYSRFVARYFSGYSYFPLAGYGNGPAALAGYYWSSTPSSSMWAERLDLTPASSSVSTDVLSSQYSVRCVRTVCARTGSPSFAVRGALAFPLAGYGGSGEAAVEGNYWSTTGGTYTYCLVVRPDRSSVGSGSETYRSSVRCVRTVCARTGRPSFAVRGTFAFPLAGDGSSPASGYGYYWSSTAVTGGGNAYTLYVTPSSSSVASKGKTNQYSVRCVRAACARTGRPSFAVRGAFAFPLAGNGSSPAGVGGYYWSSSTVSLPSGTAASSLALTRTGSSGASVARTSQYSVRCVRAVCARTGRPFDGIWKFRMKIEMRLQRVSCRNPHHPARCMRSEPCLFSNPPELRKRSCHLSDAGVVSDFDASVMFRRLSRRSRRDDSVRGHAPRMVFAVLSSDFPVVAWGFPLAGNGSSPANVNGYYWSSTTNNNNAYNLNVTPTSSSVTNNNKTNQYSVRCVRTVCARTGRPSF